MTPTQLIPVSFNPSSAVKKPEDLSKLILPDFILTLQSILRINTTCHRYNDIFRVRSIKCEERCTTNLLRGTRPFKLYGQRRGEDLAKVRPGGGEDLAMKRGCVRIQDFPCRIRDLTKVRLGEFCKRVRISCLELV